MLKEVILLSKVNDKSIVNPLEKIFISLGAIIILGFSKSYLPIIINIIFFGFMHFKNKHYFNIVMKFSLGTAAFALISSITFFFDYGAKATFLIIAKSFSGGLCVGYLSLTTPMDDILNLLHKSKYLQDFCDIAKSMERFILLLEEELIIMTSSVKSRNGFDTFNLKIKNSAKIAGLLFVNTLRRWDNIKDAINSRCYNGTLNYTANYNKINVRHMLFIGMYLLFVSVIMII
ncbi:CbiQ family ECF transporter T component [Clostridium algidicarnis]|uniref:CbiQ family ECF transporter T component n=1 Tax=Clostridium algidicarnis TaxID=37659 RepID=UPI001627C005|nr:CbiQ family ECF transporter T component [Clostridium algidicarnis]MBB6630254.1 cobalt ABC transporter permease [Clostridium algidicarnis]MBB6697674.1 cobalt ABC transporter permease [Clostridium algidicarnis]MBU3203470.1 cobalt ABC transporter permease [Clostridium algidicarnis]MBU3206206.1 cobalt ABC transporter permease [Clostridium algidicarnis]MBU3211624.1 cobalt ABC transporter permease [Clostridium algidicarnis]